MMDSEKKGEISEPAVVPSDLQPLPPSKAASLHSGDLDNDKKYETIQTIKMNEPSGATTAAHNNLKPTTMEKSMSMMNSSLNLLANQEVHHEKQIRKGIAVNTKLGIVQLVLSVLLSAFGGLLIARNASLSMLGSGNLYLNQFLLFICNICFMKIRCLVGNNCWRLWRSRINKHKATDEWILSVQFDFGSYEYISARINWHRSSQRL
jgi:hypothetical protein